MSRALRILVCEDTEDDYDLLLLELTRIGYDVTDAVRVQTADAMRAALAAAPPEIVFSDWSMPSFLALDALETLHESGLDVPFIIVSGTIGEETAVEALRNGAHDFLIKSRMARLGVAIDRALREAGARREQQRMQEQLTISDRMASVGILAAGVAHEINNPLAAVLANLGLALEELDQLSPDARQILFREELEDARMAAERVRDIVRDLRIFARTEEEPRSAVDLHRVMDSTIRLASNEIRHRARLVRDFQAIGPVVGTEARLGQVFLNLIVNAVQALPEGMADRNEIRVTIAPAGDHARITIEDTGPGIPPEAMKRLFTPFFTTKPAGIGTGLGLSICHRIVTAFGGTIQAENQPGAGARFTVQLPLAASQPEQPTTQPLPLQRATRRGAVLVIDDEPMMARAVQRAIAGGHDLVAAAKGSEALRLVREGARFDVILCDLMMPEVTGMDVYDELLRIAPDQADSMVFLTGGAFTPRAQDFLARVSNPCIEKPFDPMHLSAVISDRVEAKKK